ncbi:MAG: malate dehydrogenase [Coriobacteriaceae bacterium]|nr:malate dehydrogenase [Coriobacteriaceae bacterium]
MAYPKVTIVGAGNVGATAAELLVLKGIADVVLCDVVEGLPQGKALDMMHMRSIEKFGPTITGTNDYADTAGSDVVVITAGVARKPGMTREDLIDVNSKIMKDVIGQAKDASPEAVFICVTNPLDVMTYLAFKEAGLPKQRLMGMGGVLDSARYAYAIAEATGAPIDSIDAYAVGAHGAAMVTLPRFSTVDGRPLPEVLTSEQIEATTERTVNGGAEVVALLKTGSAFYAPGSSIARMVSAIVGDTHEVMSVCAYLEGEYGIEDAYMCVPVKLGRGGVEEIVEFDLDDAERAALQDSAASIIKQVEGLGLR